MNGQEAIAPLLRFRTSSEMSVEGGRLSSTAEGRARTPAAPWTRKRLGDFGKLFNGLNGKTKADFGHGEGRYVTYLGIFSNPIVSRENCAPIEVDTSQNEVKCGDVFFTTSSETPDEVGMSAVWLDDATNTYLNSFCFGFRPNGDNDSEFLAYLFRSLRFRDNMAFLAQGISRYNISKGRVMNISVALPSDSEEQHRIGSFFRSLDALIAGREKSLEKLDALKKSMLLKMFPQGDAKVPEVRFKGFGDEWEKKRLGGILDYEQPQQYIVSTTEYVEQGIPVLTVGKTGILGYTDEKSGIYPASIKPTILFDDFLEISRYVDFDFKVKSSAVKMLSIKRGEECDLQFIAYLMKSGERVADVHARHWIGSTSEKEVAVPSLPEQQKIGAYFRSLDALIAARREEIEKLKQMKKALLERMFV